MNLPKRAFTLIELLVVIGIISVLVAMLFPVIALVKSEGKKASCLSNLRQIGSSIALYTNDYDGKLPYAPDSLHKYVLEKGLVEEEEPLRTIILQTPAVTFALKSYGAIEEIFHCPQDHFKPIDYKIGNITDPDWFRQVRSSYQYYDKAAFQGMSLTDFPKPPENFLAGEYSYFHHGDSGRDGIVNVLFCDLHVKSVGWMVRSDILEEMDGIL